MPTKVCLVKTIVFPVVMYGCESWTIKKAECWRIDAFELWCWRRLLRVPWAARRSNQSILKEESTPGVGDGQGGLVCCNSQGRKESEMTERLNWTYPEFNKLMRLYVLIRPTDMVASMLNVYEIRKNVLESMLYDGRIFSWTLIKYKFLSQFWPICSVVLTRLSFFLELTKVMVLRVNENVEALFKCITSLLLSLFSCWVMSDSLRPHGLQHTRLPCPSLIISLILISLLFIYNVSNKIEIPVLVRILKYSLWDLKSLIFQTPEY